MTRRLRQFAIGLFLAYAFLWGPLRQDFITIASSDSTKNNDGIMIKKIDRIYIDHGIARSGSAFAKTSTITTTLSTKNETHNNFQYSPDIKVYAPTNSKSTVAICLIVKDELLYIDEFLDYHIALGFSPIYIYDNSLNFEMQNWLTHKRNDIQQRIKLYHFPKAPVQLAAYTRCIHHDAKNETFVALIDTDEFLLLKKHDNVIDFMDQHCDEHCGQLSINWKMMGTSNETHFKPLPVTKRNVHTAGVEGTIKVIVRPDYAAEDLAWRHSIQLKKGHWVDTTGKYVDNKGWKRQANDNGPSDVALLYHYRYKSDQEHRQKLCERGGSLDRRGELRFCEEGKSRMQYERGMYGNVFDDAVWKEMVRLVPKYAVFDDASMKVTTMNLYPIKNRSKE